MNSRALQTTIALILACLWGVGLGVIHMQGGFGFLDRVEATMTDLRTLIRGVRPPPNQVTIIAIDDDTVREIGSYPVPRATLAKIIDSIASFKPKAIAIDLLFVDSGPETGDAALARSLARSNSVIAAAAVYPEGQQWAITEINGPLPGLPEAERFLLPLQRFLEVAKIGIVNLVTDRTGTPRLFPMLFRTNDRLETSLPLRAAAVAIGKDPVIESGSILLGGRSIPTDFGHVLPINFYGPHATIRTVSALAALNGNLSPDIIQGRVVVIGAAVTGGGDVFPTPFDPVLPGMEVISTAISHLLNGDALVRDERTRLADAGIAVLLPMILVGLLGWRRSLVGFVAMICVVMVWLAINMAAFFQDIWLSASLPVFAASPPALLFGLIQIWLSRRHAQHFANQSELLQRFQSPALSDWLVRNPGFLSKPVNQVAAIVFIDLSGFTGLSETLGPNAVRDLLNAFYKLLEEEAVACSGTITSFMGDGAMIVFGLPEPTVDDASNAAQCCARLSSRTQVWLASLPKPIASRIGFKIGAHIGEIIASRLGGGSQQQITATGDTVNVASRLMEVAASHGAELAVSDNILQTAGHDCALHKLGVLSGPMETEIRGRSGSLAVWLWQSPNVSLQNQVSV